MVMTPRVAPGDLRVVLTWNQRPYDLDLWVTTAFPLPSYENAVFWGQRNKDNPLKDIMKGVQLDTDQKVRLTSRLSSPQRALL